MVTSVSLANHVPLPFARLPAKRAILAGRHEKIGLAKRAATAVSVSRNLKG